MHKKGGSLKYSFEKLDNNSLPDSLGEVSITLLVKEAIIKVVTEKLKEYYLSEIREAIIKVVAEKLREYYLRGIRDARIEQTENSMPSFLEQFDAGDFDSACDTHVWLKIASDLLDM